MRPEVAALAWSALAWTAATAASVSELDAGGTLVPVSKLDDGAALGEPPLRVLFSLPYAERIPELLSHYGPLNWTMIMAMGAVNLASCHNLCGDQCSCVLLPEPCDSTVKNLDGTHKISMRVHDLLIAPFADGSSNLLFAHADMWMSRRMGALLRSDTYRDKMVLPRSPSEHMCHQPGTTAFDNVKWMFWESFGPRCAAAVGSASPPPDDESPDVLWPLRGLGQCCYGWVDLFYLPKAAQALFAQLATGPLASVEMHEASIVTIAHALAREGIADLVDFGCQGDCCNSAKAKLLREVTNATTCMHPRAQDPVDLSDAEGWARVVEW